MKAVIAFALVPLVLHAGPFEVSLVQVQTGKPLGDEVPFEVRPLGYDPGVKLGFLVRGENLVAFKDESVAIKSFKLGDGREWSHTRSGKANWEEGFAKVSEDGKVGSFTVSFPGDLFGAIEGASLDGTVAVITASKTEEQKIELIAGDKAEKQLGAFKISASEGGTGLFGGGSNGTSITLTGDHKAVVEVTVMDGGKKLDDNGSSSFNDTKTYHFEKAKGEKLDVTVRYWTDLKEEAVPFKMEPAKK